MYCTNCGTKLDNDSVFCSECGHRQEPETPSEMTFASYYSAQDIQPDTTARDNSGAFRAVLAEKLGALKDKTVAFLGTKNGKVTAVLVCVAIVLSVAILRIIPLLSKPEVDNSTIVSSDYASGDDLLEDFSESEGDSIEILHEDYDTQIDPPLSENGYVYDYSVKWLVQPTVDADRIDVLRCGSVQDKGFDTYDTNSIGLHKYDRISLLEHDGNYGIIINSGGQVTGVEFTNIEIGNDDRYLLTAKKGGNDVWYTLTSRYELSKLDYDDVWEMTYSDEGYKHVWVEGQGLSIKSYGATYPWNYNEPEPSYAMAVPYYSNGSSNSSGYVIVVDGERLNDVIYEDAGSFSDDVAPVKKGGKWGYINVYGQLVLPFEFDACWKTDIGMRPYNVSDGYITVCRNGSYALYDTWGDCIIDYGMFERIGAVYEGACWVRSGGYWGVIAVEDDAVTDQTVKNDTSTSRKAWVNSSDGLRMREGPGTDYCVVHMLSNHKEVTVYGNGGEWVYISQNGVFGWVKSEFLDY